MSVLARQSTLGLLLLQSVLQELALLDRFPENPLLEQVLKVKSRVLALPAGAPLPQLLTGLELLLFSCHEWQKNTHRGVSLQDQMDQLTLIILCWRKLELVSWSLLLASVGQAAGGDRPALASPGGHGAGGLLGKHAKNNHIVFPEAGSPTEEVVRATVRFLEAATVVRPDELLGPGLLHRAVYSLGHL